jgi:hypothetical protein
LKLAGETDNPACVPVPLSAMLSDGFDALLVIVIDPVALPDAVGENVVLSVTLADGFTVTGAVAPVTANALPFMEIPVMFTAAEPVLLTTICWAPLLLPTATLPKFTLAGDADSWPTAVFEPVPLNGTLSVGFVGSLLVIVILPEAAPAAAGVNVTANVADELALIVAGVVTPLVAKSAPVTLMTETVKAALPRFDMTRFDVPFEPTETVPKLIELWPKEICGCDPLTAFADSATVAGVLPPSPVTVNVPETLPAVLGVTATDRFPDCPTPSAIGSVVPERANWELEKVACVILTATVPVFVTETFCIDFLPTVTVPKLTFVGLSWNSAATACCACLTMPAHPLSSVSAGINSNKAGRTLAMRYCTRTGFIFFPTVSATAAHGLSPVP